MRNNVYVVLDGWHQIYFTGQRNEERKNNNKADEQGKPRNEKRLFPLLIFIFAVDVVGLDVFCSY